MKFWYTYSAYNHFLHVHTNPSPGNIFYNITSSINIKIFLGTSISPISIVGQSYPIGVKVSVKVTPSRASPYCHLYIYEINLI